MFRTFQAFLQEVDAGYGNLIYHIVVHWLSKEVDAGYGNLIYHMVVHWPSQGAVIQYSSPSGIWIPG
jgi:hypothetical protein